MNPAYYISSYADHLSRLERDHGKERAMELLVGDADHWVGVLEYAVLLNLGLRPTDFVVDVGCGTGRLSNRLARCGFAGRFLGTDLLPAILEYARERTQRPDWTFSVAAGPPLPANDGTADWVTFFSVFTHILDEDIFLYLKEARRLLRPGGKIVFSFLEFSERDHWSVFEQSLADRAAVNAPLNRFIDRSTLRMWAEKLGMAVHGFFDGADPWIKITPPVCEEEQSVSFWQSIGVFSLPPAPSGPTCVMDAG